MTLNCLNKSQSRPMVQVTHIVIHNKLRGGPSLNIPAIGGGGVNSHVILRVLEWGNDIGRDSQSSREGTSRKYHQVRDIREFRRSLCQSRTSDVRRCIEYQVRGVYLQHAYVRCRCPLFLKCHSAIKSGPIAHSNSLTCLLIALCFLFTVNHLLELRHTERSRVPCSGIAASELRPTTSELGDHQSSSFKPYATAS